MRIKRCIKSPLKDRFWVRWHVPGLMKVRFSICTRVSVHRRDRCTCTSTNLGPVFDIFITVAFRTCVSVHRRDRCTRTSFNQGFFVDIFATVAFRTCVSAHRRDRCTRTLLNQGLVFDLFTTVAFVLVCLSIDVTGAPVPCPTKAQ